MSHFRPIVRDTAYLFPPSVDEWLPQRHLARYVKDRLKLRGLLLEGATSAPTRLADAAYFDKLRRKAKSAKSAIRR